MTKPPIDGEVFEAVVVLALEALAKEADIRGSRETSGSLGRMSS